MKKYLLLLIMSIFLISCDLRFIFSFNTSSESTSESIECSDTISESVSIISSTLRKPIYVTYHLYGGSIPNMKYQNKVISDINYYNTGYWDYYKTGVFLYESSVITKPEVAPIYADKIGIIKHNLENEYIVNQIIPSGSAFTNNLDSDYYILVHYENEEDYLNLVTRERNSISLNDIVTFTTPISELSSGEVTNKVYFSTNSSSYMKMYTREAILETPSKKDVAFLGYYTSADYTGDVISSTKQSIDVYARWDEEMYVPTLDDIVGIRNKNILLYGNDISAWQETNNFSKMKNYSKFLILKIGGNDNNKGCYEDSKFYQNVMGCITYNIPFGVYFYSGATSVEIAKKEANYVVSIIKKYNLDDGKISYPIYMDYENNSFMATQTKAANRNIINAFAEVIFENGFYPGVYVGALQAYTYIDYEGVICDFWVAIWWKGSAKDSLQTFFSEYPYNRFTMWQFDDGEYNDDTLSGKTLGAGSSNVDQDYCFIDYPSLIKAHHLNGY